MRKRDLLRQRQISFNNSYHINEVALPFYNPLQDKYLAGYLDNPRIKRRLADTGLIRFERKSVSRPKTSQKLKLLTDNEKVKLPNIQDMMLQHNLSNPQAQSSRVYPSHSKHGQLNNIQFRNINHSHHQFHSKQKHQNKIHTPRNIGTSYSTRKRHSQINNRNQKKFVF